MKDILQLEFACHISDLLCKYIFQEISDDELILLHGWAYANPENEALFEEMKNPITLLGAVKGYLEICND